MAQVNPCVQNCPQRSVLCHAGCEAYNEYHKQREAEMKRRAQKADEAGFYHEARQAVKKNMKGRSDMTKIILVVLVIAATLTECIVMRKSREYDAADNIAGLERCVKAMVVLGFVGIAAAVAFVAM